MAGQTKLKKPPSLQTVSILTIGGTLLVLLGVLLLVLVINMYHLLVQNEQEHIRERSKIATGILSASTRNMQAITRDWSSWDETYAFVLGENEDFAADVMNDYPFLLHSMNFAIIKDLNGNDLYERFFDFYAEEGQPAPPGLSAALAPVARLGLSMYEYGHEYSFREKLGVDGFFFYGGVCYYICCLPVLTSDETSEPVGSYFFGRIVDEAEIQRITGNEALEFSILDRRSAEAQALNLSFSDGEATGTEDGNISYYRLLPDIFGADTVILFIHEPRSLYKDGLDVIRLTSLLAGGAMLICIAVLLVLISRLLLRPLRRLSATMAAITPYAASIDTDGYGTKELVILVSSANAMLTTLRQSRQSLEASTVSLGVLSNILNGIDAYLHVSDPETDQLLFVNEKIKELHGLTDDAVGRVCWQMLGDNPSGRCGLCPDTALLERRGVPVVWEEHSAGRYYKNVDSIIEWAGGKKVRLQHSTDITDLIEAKKQAEAGSRAKGEFLSRMSHEMRTPMTAVIGMTAIARKSSDPVKKEYCLDKIDSASRHLLGVINDILDMSKIESGKFELSPAEFDFESMLMSTANMVIFRTEEKNQELIVKMDPNIPASLIGDEQRLSQVITNLLSNAVKFTPEGGKITLDTRVQAFDGQICTLCFEVSDTGIGISDEQQSRLFTSFEQADGGVARKYGGTGLGLAISKKIVTLMGGEIHIQSELGEGARFIFTVQMQAGKSRRAVPAAGIDWKALRVLAVDDTPEIREYFRHVMAGFGIPCDTAADAGEALSLVRREGGAYDIIFIDWHMPAADGIELARQIRGEGSRARIVLISSGDLGSIEKEATQAGVERLVSKPLFPSVLMDTMSVLMGHATPGAGKKPAEEGGERFYGRTLLLAEDVDVNREILMAALEDTGVEIDCAGNGAQALSMFERAPQRYDLIFMDVQMPEMDGYEATRRIRALAHPKAASVPIVAMTANVFREDVRQCLEAGMNDHLGKPLDTRELLDMLKKYLQ